MPQEIRNSLHPGTPVYYQVDLLKALIMDYMTRSSQHEIPYCVISDFDIKPMDSKEIFDKKTVMHLSKQGYVFNGRGWLGFENSFYIFNRDVRTVIDKHFENVIIRTAKIIEDLRHVPVGKSGYQIPSTTNGRNCHKYNKEEAIDELKDWKELPLAKNLL
jgi:hypothetical protein